MINNDDFARRLTEYSQWSPRSQAEYSDPRTPILFIRSADGGQQIVIRSFVDWGDYYDAATPDRRRELDAMVRDGTLLGADGEPLTGTALILARQRLFRAQRGGNPYNSWDVRNIPGSNPEPMRMLIPGLWPWGWRPFLGGTPKAGKTKLVTNLAGALLNEGQRFLGHFEPVTLTEKEREQDVIVVINAETPPQAFEQELRIAGVTDDDLYSEGGRLGMIHLENEGGPGQWT